MYAKRLWGDKNVSWRKRSANYQTGAIISFEDQQRLWLFTVSRIQTRVNWSKISCHSKFKLKDTNPVQQPRIDNWVAKKRKLLAAEWKWSASRVDRIAVLLAQKDNHEADWRWRGTGRLNVIVSAEKVRAPVECVYRGWDHNWPECYLHALQQQSLYRSLFTRWRKDSMSDE